MSAPHLREARDEVRPYRSVDAGLTAIHTAFERLLVTFEPDDELREPMERVAYSVARAAGCTPSVPKPAPRPTPEKAARDAILKMIGAAALAGADLLGEDDHQTALLRSVASDFDAPRARNDHATDGSPAPVVHLFAVPDSQNHGHGA